MDLDNHYCILLPNMNPSYFKFFNLVNTITAAFPIAP